MAFVLCGSNLGCLKQCLRGEEMTEKEIKMQKKILNLARPSKNYYAGPIFVYVSNGEYSLELEIDEEDRNNLLREVDNIENVLKLLRDIAKENGERLPKEIEAIDLELWDNEEEALKTGNTCVDLISFHNDYESINWNSYNPEEWK